MKRIAVRLATAVFGLALSGVAAAAQPNITIDYDHSINFENFHTYTWASVHATEPAVEQRVSIAANRSLAGRYMKEAGKDADVTMTAIEAGKDPQEYASFYSGLTDWTWQRGWTRGFLDTAAAPENTPLHTLVIDMYDTKSHKLLWRGAITLPADQATGSEADRKFDKAVTELIGKYPPKYKK
jgi:hypothetical protein